MIEIANLHIYDEKARTICEKHIQKNIVSGLSYYIDTYANYDEDDEKLLVDDYFQTEKCFGDLFPKDFSGDRMGEMIRIRDLVLSDEVVELTAFDKYVLIHALEDFYADYKGAYTLSGAAAMLVRKDDGPLSVAPITDVEDRFYVLLMAAKTADSFLHENEEEVEFTDLVETIMRDVEDLSGYAEVCFEDLDYEFLGDFTREELLGNPTTEMMGLDV